MNLRPVDDCPFCSQINAMDPEPEGNCVWLMDAYPVSEGHSLVVPIRHVASLDDLDEIERWALWDEILAVKAELMAVLPVKPDGFNVGINDGKAAGQTVLHLHVHIIPRYNGDVADPRGGVRWVVPSKAKYWE
jgi:diadenosine tetraphosphate (Ap4A) HIT family hydrolase